MTADKVESSPGIPNWKVGGDELYWEIQTGKCAWNLGSWGRDKMVLWLGHGL